MPRRYREFRSASPQSKPGSGLAEPRDRLVDQRLVGLVVEILLDQPGGGGGGGAGGAGADLVDRGALGGGDLVLGHAGAALDQGGGVGLGLLDYAFGLVAGALDHRRRLGVGGGGPGLIFGLERLGVGAELPGFLELVADGRDLAVEG